MKPRSLIALALALWAGPIALANANVVIDPTTYVLISSSRVTRDIFDFEYTVAATNTGTTQANDCIGQVTSLSATTTVRDAFIKFPPLAPSASATSADTFTIRQDRNLAFDPNNLSWQITCTNSSNTQPVANAGADQTVFIGSIVTLDGSNSTDADADPLTFQWTLLSRPAGSAATLSSATAVMPTFVADVAGQYDVQLIVHDGTVSSVPDLVVISTMPVNTPPVAHAGPDVNAFVNDLVVLDGTASTDVDGEPLTFSWAIVTAPTGSTAVLAGADTPQPSFVPNVAGNYTVRLTVSDPNGATDTDDVVVSTQQPNLVPVAEAGAAQVILNKHPVLLSGKDSFDPEGVPLTYAWSFVSRPAGSNAVLIDPTGVTVSFTPDAAGEYVVQLIVSDGVRFSLPDTVLVTSNNAPPVADAGVDQLVSVGTVTQLDASASFDANNDPLAYFWSFTSQPPGGTTVINGAQTPNPSFTPNRSGLYVAQLIVNDGTVDSPPDTVSITVDPLPAINLPGSVTVGFRRERTISVTLTRDSAHSGAVAVSLASSNPSVISVSTPPVTIPAGQDTATFTLFGQSLGTVTLTATASGFPTATTDAATSAGVRFENPVPEILVISQGTLWVKYESPVGHEVPTPTGGIPLTFASANPACVTVGSGGTIPQGHSGALFTGIYGYGGTATLPCTTTLTVSSSSVLASDTHTITVLPMEHLFFPFQLLRSVGAGLQQRDPQTVTLSTANHGGVTVRIASADPTRVLISPNATTLGGAFADVFVPNGSDTASFVIQGADWTPGVSIEGPVAITATAPGFRSHSGSVGFLRSAVSITDPQALTTDPSSISENRAYYVAVGYPLLNSVSSDPVRVGTSLTVTVANSNAAAGELDPIGGGSGTQTRTMTIPGGQRGSLALTGFEFDPLGPGLTTLVAAGPHLAPTSQSTRTFTVQGRTLTIANPTGAIGGGLQALGVVNLSGPSHGGVTVRITSSDPTRVRLRPNRTTPPSTFIDIPVPNGVATASFRAEALPWVVGTSTSVPVTLTATTTGFSSGTASLTYVQPGVQLINLPASTTLISPNLEFSVRVGAPSGDGVTPQIVPDGSPLLAAVTNSFAAVGQLEGDGGTQGAQQRTVAIENSSDSSSSEDGIEFDSTGVGTTTVSASIPGFIATPLATQSVHVTFANGPAPVGLTTLEAIGAGLQSNTLIVDLPHGQHGGTSVTVASSDPSRVLIAPNQTTTGSASRTFAVPSGASSVEFVVQAVDWVSGTSVPATVDISVSTTSNAFTNTTGSVEYMQSALGILGLPEPDQVTSTSSNIDFQVFVGLLDLAAEKFTPQRVKPGSGLSITLTNSNAAVAELDMNGGGNGAQSYTVMIPAGQVSTPFDAAGGVEFDPLGIGSTRIDATSPGYITFPFVASQEVEILQ